MPLLYEYIAISYQKIIIKIGLIYFFSKIFVFGRTVKRTDIVRKKKQNIIFHCMISVEVNQNHQKLYIKAELSYSLECP